MDVNENRQDTRRLDSNLPLKHHYFIGRDEELEYMKTQQCQGAENQVNALMEPVKKQGQKDL